MLLERVADISQDVLSMSVLDYIRVTGKDIGYIYGFREGIIVLHELYGIIVAGDIVCMVDAIDKFGGDSSPWSSLFSQLLPIMTNGGVLSSYGSMGELLKYIESSKAISNILDSAWDFLTGEYNKAYDFYQEHCDELFSTYGIKGIRIRSDDFNSRSLDLDDDYSRSDLFVDVSGKKSSDVLYVMEKLLERKDRWEFWQGVYRIFLEFGVSIRSGKNFEVLSDTGIRLFGKGWNLDDESNWVTRAGKWDSKLRGYIIEASNIMEFRDRIRFRYPYENTQGATGIVKSLGDIADLLDEGEVEVLKGIVSKVRETRRVTKNVHKISP